MRPKVHVVVLDLHGVVEHVVADRLVVGPEGGDSVHVAKLFAVLHAIAVFVTSMRFGRAVPEAPCLAFGNRA